MSKQIPLVIVESPFAGSPEQIKKNIEYVRAAMHDCLRRGEAPFASHALYTLEGVLDDTIPDERKLGIEAGLAWGRAAHLTAVYVDRGISNGMREGIRRARSERRPIALRRLGLAWHDEGIRYRISDEDAHLFGAASAEGLEHDCGQTCVVLPCWKIMEPVESKGATVLGLPSPIVPDPAWLARKGVDGTTARGSLSENYIYLGRVSHEDVERDVATDGRRILLFHPPYDEKTPPRAEFSVVLPHVHPCAEAARALWQRARGTIFDLP